MSIAADMPQIRRLWRELAPSKPMLLKAEIKKGMKLTLHAL